MNELLKNLGVIVLLIGVAVLAVPFYNGTMTNTYLLAGVSLVIFGYICHIALNKRFE